MLKRLTVLLLLAFIFVMQAAASNMVLASEYEATDSLEEITPDGWIEVEDNRFFYQDGVRQTGWLRLDGIGYFLNPDQDVVGHTANLPVGAMRTGWINLDGAHYYLGIDGRMRSGGWHWVRISNANSNLARFYFNDSGRMRTGWIEVDGIHYYLGESGRMRSGGWHQVRFSNSNPTLHWFYFNNSGHMLTGWQWIRRSSSDSTLDWFYLGTSGAMRTGWQWIRHSNSNATQSWHFFEDNGTWQRQARFIRPMARATITSEFRPPTRPNHNGVDMAGAINAPILAAAPGEVVRRFTTCVEGNQTCNHGRGNYVVIRHRINNTTYYTLYAHLSTVNVNIGVQVSEGQQIGRQGNTGHSTGPHLHFEIHRGNFGNHMSPRDYIYFPPRHVWW